jgi:hypothetical protein
MAAVGLSNIATAILLAAPDVIPVPMDAPDQAWLQNEYVQLTSGIGLMGRTGIHVYIIDK